MFMNCNRAKKFFGGPALVFILILMLFRADIVATGIIKGLDKSVKSLIPALFPLMVICEFIIICGFENIFSKFMSPFCRIMKIKCKVASTAITMGFIGGFACGGTVISGFFNKNLISKREAEILTICSCVTGPAFCISVVGGGLLNNTSTGIAIFFSLICSSLITAILFSYFMKNIKDTKNVSNITTDNMRPVPGFVNAVNSATSKMLYICGFVVFFSAVIELCNSSNLSNNIKGTISVLLEVTFGCSAAINFNSFAIQAIIFSLSTLSLCGVTQLRAIIPYEISLKPFIYSRLVSVPLSCVFFRIFINLIPAASYVGTSLSEKMIVTSSLPWESAVVTFMLIATICKTLKLDYLPFRKKIV